MKQAFLKNTLREIINTKARFFSIMAIIALGVGFFAGIKATSPSMYNLAEQYYRDKNLMDFRLVSTTGFSENDIKAVSELEGVESVMPSYFCDVMTSADDGGDIVRLISVPKAYENNAALNTLTMREGKTARKSGEIVTESVAFANVRHEIGSKVTFAPTAGDNSITDLLKTNEFTVTGKAESPLYISYQRGATTIGDGKISEYMYICAEDFKLPRYTELYVKTDYSDSVSAFSDEYQDKTEALKARLEALAEDREAAFTVELQQSEKDLAAAKKEYADQKAAAGEKLSAALAEIESGEELYNTKLSEAEEKLREAEEQIASGEAALEEGERAYNEGIASGQEQIAAGKEELISGQEQLDSARNEFDTQLAEKQKALDEETTPTNPPAESVEEAVDNILSGITAQTEKNAAQVAIDVEDAIGKAQMAVAQAQLAAGQAQLAQGETELSVQKISGKDQLTSGKMALEAAKEQYESGKAEYEAQKESGAKQLAEARAEYAKGKAEAEKLLAEGLEKIEDGEAALEKMQGMTSTWYVFTRDDNPGYPTFTQNADRLDAVASVFPLFFLLVAVLVCVTTMTRLIEEKRTEIATLKALGYSNGAIILKYVIYSLIAAVTGSVLGVALGVNTLPFIIYNAYKIMYYIGDITLVLNIPSIVIGMLAAVVCTSAVSVIVCAKSLKAKPAQAMRPKAPKPGKRILLERITPLWKRMGFTAKLTARNLFRYKVRLGMTVIGVAGCTALIVAAFGLLNSFEPLTEAQFKEIYKYDVTVIPKTFGTAEELSYLTDLADGTGQVSASMLSLREEATLSFNGKATTENTFIAVPEDPERLDELTSLHTRIGKNPLTLDGETILLNEKLAAEFGISVGDTVTLTTENGTAEIKVSGIYEQYIYNFAYMTPKCYESLFGSEPVYNTLEAKMIDNSDETTEAFSSAMLGDSRVVAISFMAQNVDDFRNMLNSLNMVALVMIVCAAALAFVVLYNLTNINIAERVREIATFKVLGFYNGETSRFIYIENIILTLLGIIVGEVLGIILTRFIVSTVEVDNVMFGRDIFFTTFLYAAGLTMLFSLLVNAAMSFKIRKVNMVESLKSVE